MAGGRRRPLSPTAVAGLGLGVLAVGASLALVSCRCSPAGKQPGPSAAAPAASTGKVTGDASVGEAQAAATASADAAVIDAAAEDAGPKLEPLTAEGPYVSLPVEGFRDAVVSVPLGATEPRPVVVALHGNFDRPEWQCQIWREITDGYPFILCPRGVPRGDAPKSWDRWTYGAMKKVKEELLAGLDALEKDFGEHADDGPVIFTGFSLGAILGRYIVRDHAERFPRVVFTEGGNKGWEWLARAFKKGGGERVLFACGQAGCVYTSRAAAKRAEAVELRARVADGGKAGHTYDGTVMAAIKDNWDWLVQGDARWPGGATSPEADAGLADAAAADGSPE